MRVYVDFSVLTPKCALGNVHGEMELEAIPNRGELVTFAKPTRFVEPLQVVGFIPQLRVQDVVLPARSDNAVPLVSLEDVVLARPEDADSLFQYFEAEFGLYADRYDSAEG